MDVVVNEETRTRDGGQPLFCPECGRNLRPRWCRGCGGSELSGCKQLIPCTGRGCETYQALASDVSSSVE